jgi:hypothetical protein
VAAYVVTVRTGPRVERERFDELGAALDWIEERGRALERDASAKAIDLKMIRRFEPVQQVVARIELSGPRRLRAGIDVRGDGSSEGYTGRIRRHLIDQRPEESPYEALRRAVAS